MGIVKFSIWLNITSKYRGFICHCFCYCGYIFRKIYLHILLRFFPLGFFWVFLYLQLMWNVLLNSLFHQKWPAFFCFWFVWYLPPALVLRMWVLFLKRKLSIAFSVSSCLESDMYKNFFQSQTWLCVVTANTGINPNQKQHELTLS